MLRLPNLICAVLGLVVAAMAVAQEEGKAARESVRPAASSAFHRPDEAGCGRCHYCRQPTSLNRCLLQVCTRGQFSHNGIGADADRGPDVVCLDYLEGDYLPVPFDHQGHANMAEMGGGCGTCHHHTTEGQQHPPCRACHDVFAAGTDIYKPGLKGAFHQQCVNCHREWVDETDCGICHVIKADRSSGRDRGVGVTADDLLGRVHPPIPEPETEFYRGLGGGAADSRVIFRHREHVARFDLNCVDCHHEPSCARCHTQGDGSERPRTLAEHHRPCLRCHKDNMDGSNDMARCENCHWQEGKPKPAPFDHARTGWPLSRFHTGKSCRACHAKVPFTRLSKDCNSCHGDWSSTTFDHRVTGQALDENHAGEDCAMCHLERRFDRPPACGECHEEGEGFVFPQRRPGPLTRPVQLSAD